MLLAHSRVSRWGGAAGLFKAVGAELAVVCAPCSPGLLPGYSGAVHTHIKTK